MTGMGEKLLVAGKAPRGNHLAFIIPLSYMWVSSEWVLTTPYSLFQSPWYAFSNLVRNIFMMVGHFSLQVLMIVDKSLNNSCVKDHLSLSLSFMDTSKQPLSPLMKVSSTVVIFNFPLVVVRITFEFISLCYCQVVIECNIVGW